MRSLETEIVGASIVHDALARAVHIARLDGGLLLPVVDLLKVQFTEPLVLLDVIRAALRVIVHADV